MPRVEQAIDIQAPVSVVFDLIANQPERQPEWWKPIELQQRITPAPTTIGSVARYVYNMLGVRIKGEHQVLELEPNQRLLVKTISGLDSTFTFSFTPITENCTRLHLQVNYILPGSVIGQLLNRLAVERKNESDLYDGLHNLKKLIEAETQQP